MRLQTILVGLTVVFMSSGPAAEAGTIPITWGPSVFDPETILFDGSGETSCTAGSLPASLNCKQLVYSHDLTAFGFVPGLTSDDQLTGGLLEIFLQDDTDQGNQAEGFKFLLENIAQGGTQSATTTFSFGSFSATVLASIQADGILNVTFDYQNGDFFFLKSEFTGRGTRFIEEENPTLVPEPASLLLFGTGVAALAARRRRARV